MSKAQKNPRSKVSHVSRFFLGMLCGAIGMVVIIAVLSLISSKDLLTDGFREFVASFEKEKGIINAHEHIQSINEVDKLLEVMQKVGISKMVLVGSPDQTIYYTGEKGFSNYDQNNEELLKIQSTHPDQFIAFPTISPDDPEKLEKFKDLVKRGAQGLKLYSGHSFFYTLPLDDPSMLPVYEYAEKNKIPVMWHVNAGHYLEEFENVLNYYPDLKVICPHFCLSSIKLDRLTQLLDAYPNLYTDISFGYKDYQKTGYERISKNPEKYQEFFKSYSDRIFYGTDAVVTAYEGKSIEWLTNNFQAYRDLLEKETYTYFLMDDPAEQLNGLALDQEILDKIYYQNWEKFFED